MSQTHNNTTTTTNNNVTLTTTDRFEVWERQCTAMWNLHVAWRLRLKVDGTMVKLGRATGLAGVMHREAQKNEGQVKATFDRDLDHDKVMLVSEF